MHQRFRDDVLRHPPNAAILSRWAELALPDAWLVAGCLFQAVWNRLDGHPPGHGIKDHDLFYFDASDLWEAAEARAQAHASALFADLGVEVEVCNQARVHLWYASHFGRPYAALAGVEEGIRRFLVLETCVAVRPGEVYAPNGLEGLYAGTLTPNPLVPHRELFEAKVASYRSRWPWLVVAG